MAKKQSPLVTCGELHCADYSFPVEVGSGIWLDWLEKNRSFRFEMELVCEFEASPTQKYEMTQTASFSACKERRPSGEFWYATRKVNGKLRRAYLGEARRLTTARLEEVARQLHGNPEQSPSTESSPSKPETQELHTCVTDELDTLRAQNEKLRAEVARLEGELRAAAEDFQEQDKKMTALAQQVYHAQSEVVRLETERVEAIAKNDCLRQQMEELRQPQEEIQLVRDQAIALHSNLQKALSQAKHRVLTEWRLAKRGESKERITLALDRMTSYVLLRLNEK